MATIKKIIKFFILTLSLLALFACSKSDEDNAKKVAETFIVALHTVDEKEVAEYKKLEELMPPGADVVGEKITKGTVTGPNEEYTKIAEALDKDIKNLTTARAYEKISKNRYNVVSAGICTRHNYTCEVNDLIFSEDLYKANRDIDKVRYSYEANIMFESTKGKGELNDSVKGYIELLQENNSWKVSLYTIDQYPEFPENQGEELISGIPEIEKDTNLGSDLPLIVYESDQKVIFYNYMGVFIYDLDRAKMDIAIALPESGFTIKTQGDQTTSVDFDFKENIINIYQVGDQLVDYFYKYDINSDKLYKYPIDRLVQEQIEYEIKGRMDTTDWTAWNLIYTSDLIGDAYYPFRSIIKE